jgi:hypothetical protein
MDECRISDLVSEALDLDPWGVCAPSRTLDAPQRIPPTESAAIGLKTIVSPNAELGRKGLLQICSDTLHATPNVCPEELRPKWLDGAL